MHETIKAQDEQPSRAWENYSTNVLNLQGEGGQVGAFGVTGMRPAPRKICDLRFTICDLRFTIGDRGLWIEGAFDGFCTALEDVGVDHGGFHVLVTKQFLDGTDVVAVLQKLGSEGMPEGVGGDKFIYLGEAGGLLDGFLPKAYSASWFRGYDGAAGCQ